MKNEKVAKGRIIGLAGPCSSLFVALSLFEDLRAVSNVLYLSICFTHPRLDLLQKVLLTLFVFLNGPSITLSA